MSNNIYDFGQAGNFFIAGMPKYLTQKILDTCATNLGGVLIATGLVQLLFELSQ